MTMINVSGLRGPAVGKVEAAKAPQPANQVTASGAANVAAASVVGDAEKKDTSRAVEKIRAALNTAGADIPANVALVIRMDREANRFVYEFRDPTSEEVLRQYPDKEVLAALAAYRQQSTGVMVDEKA
jgi:uncharacterized FlaG/YvyC family protein